VVLFEYLRQMPPLAGWDSRFREKLIETKRALAQAAAALAPFPLPDVPAEVSPVWLFKDIGDVVVPTLPMLALQQRWSDLVGQPHYAAFEALAAAAARNTRSDINPAALPEAGADLTTIARAMHDIFQRDPELATALREKFEHVKSSDTAATHKALFATYAGPDVCYLDFYGPPRSTTTVPYHAVLKPGIVRDYRGAR